VDNDVDKKPVTKIPDRSRAQSGGAVYGLGLIGALVWYGQRAEGARGYALAVLKAMVWPAFLVYEALSAVHSLRPGDPSEIH
jgi:hypothetical protein